VTATGQPVIFLVSSDASVLWALEADLGRRFGNDTRIVGGAGPEAGLAELARFAAHRYLGRVDPRARAAHRLA
jgi:hypothetical protein